MKVAVLGASGGCGRWVMRVAADRGHEVTGLVRETADVPETPGEVRIVRGDPLDEEKVAEVLRGQDAVACCLGIRRRRSWWPWSPMLSPEDLTTRAACVLVRAMRRCEVTRIVAISAAGVGESVRAVSLPVRLMIRWSQLGVAYRDLESMENELEASGLDWLAVRPVTLTRGGLTFLAGPVTRYRPWSRVSRADVAAYMVVALEQSERFASRRVMIGRAAPAALPPGAQGDSGGQAAAIAAGAGASAS